MTHPRLPDRRRGFVVRKMRLGMVLGGLAVIAACLAIRGYWETESANADSPQGAPVRRSATPARGPAAAPSQPEAVPTSASTLRTVARVNGEEITRDELGQECLTHYGGQVLESLVNKYLIKQECQRQGVTVAQSEVNEEIEQMATRFKLPVDQWLKMLEEERGINPRQYANDIIWPTLALGKLAGDRLEVTPQELNAQYESQYGPSVQARLIVCDQRQQADSVRAAAVADPDSFAKLAKEKSVDAPSASLGGVIQPIRRHTGQPDVEAAAFALAENEISPVIPVANQFVILKCDRQIPARRIPLEQIKPTLVETLREEKLRTVSEEIFSQLQEKAQVRNILNDPAARKQMPGVVALINGQRVNERELAEVCIDRHGKEVLEGTINLRLLQQACRRQNVAVSDADVDAEIAGAAARYMRPKDDGSPDVEGWLATVTAEQNISVDAYRQTAVWPTVALKKLVGKQVTVTEEDLKSGYEANFGPRAKCLAIVLNNLRMAQQVWAKAQKNPTPEFFGDLAEQYSVEASSRSLRGEVPPIQKHGGQPMLEKAAFALAPGELSTIVNTGPELYVILLSLGTTEPVALEFGEVRDEIHSDVFEKKQRTAMADYFQKLQDSATIDNFLAGTSHTPPSVKPAGFEAKR